MRVTRVGVTVVEVPQTAPTAPYRSHLRSSSTTRSAIIRVETDDGIIGWGEHNINFLPGISARRMEQEGVVSPANHAGKRDILAGPPPM